MNTDLDLASLLVMGAVIHRTQLVVSYRTTLPLAREVVLDSCLPRSRANVRQTVGVFEHLRNVFERLASRLREQEDNVDEHAQVEDAEDDVDLVANVGKRWGHEGAERSVEGPVGL